MKFKTLSLLLVSLFINLQGADAQTFDESDENCFIDPIDYDALDSNLVELVQAVRCGAALPTFNGRFRSQCRYPANAESLHAKRFKCSDLRNERRNPSGRTFAEEECLKHLLEDPNSMLGSCSQLDCFNQPGQPPKGSQMTCDAPRCGSCPRNPNKSCEGYANTKRILSPRVPLSPRPRFEEVDSVNEICALYCGITTRDVDFDVECICESGCRPCP